MAGTISNDYYYTGLRLKESLNQCSVKNPIILTKSFLYPREGFQIYQVTMDVKKVAPRPTYELIQLKCRTYDGYDKPKMIIIDYPSSYLGTLNTLNTLAAKGYSAAMIDDKRLVCFDGSALQSVGFNIKRKRELTSIANYLVKSKWYIKNPWWVHEEERFRTLDYLDQVKVLEIMKDLIKARNEERNSHKKCDKIEKRPFI